MDRGGGIGSIEGIENTVKMRDKAQKKEKPKISPKSRTSMHANDFMNTREFTADPNGENKYILIFETVLVAAYL